MICIIAAKLYKRLHATCHGLWAITLNLIQNILEIDAYLQGVGAAASLCLVCCLTCDQKVSFQLVTLQSVSSCTISAYSARGNREDLFVKEQQGK